MVCGLSRFGCFLVCINWLDIEMFIGWMLDALVFKGYNIKNNFFTSIYNEIVKKLLKILVLVLNRCLFLSVIDHISIVLSEITICLIGKEIERWNDMV